MSEMKNIPELMERIHRYHRQLNELANRIKNGERKVLIAKKKQADALLALETRKSEQTAILLESKQKETLFSQSEQALAKRRTQLSEAKNNKEYQSLKDQIDSDQATNNRLADEALELLSKAEEYSSEVEKAKAATEEAQRGIAAAEQEIAEERPEIEKDIAHFSSLLTDAVAELPREFRGHYDRLVKNFGGESALSPVVEQSFCGFCRQQIPIRYIAQICENKPFVCQSCGRLLYLPEGYVLK